MYINFSRNCHLDKIIWALFIWEKSAFEKNLYRKNKSFGENNYSFLDILNFLLHSKTLYSAFTIKQPHFMLQ